MVDSERVAEEDFWLAGAEYADFTGRISSIVLCYTTFDEPSEDHTYADMDGNTTVATIAADMAASKGILVCNSAGNPGNDDWTYIGAPADGDSVFSIGAVDANRQYAFFSSRGPTSTDGSGPNISVMGEQRHRRSEWHRLYRLRHLFSSPLAAGASRLSVAGLPRQNELGDHGRPCSRVPPVPPIRTIMGYASQPGTAWFILKGTDFDGMPGEMVSIFPNWPAPARPMWLCLRGGTKPAVARARHGATGLQQSAESRPEGNGRHH